MELTPDGLVPTGYHVDLQSTQAQPHLLPIIPLAPFLHQLPSVCLGFLSESPRAQQSLERFEFKVHEWAI